MKKLQSITIPVLSVILGLLIGAIVMVIFGYDPVNAYSSLFKGSLGDLKAFGTAIKTATPLIFTGLGFSVASTAGFFNVGLAGQALMGWLCGVLVASWMPGAPSIVVIPIALLSAAVGGALWAAIAGVLRAYFNASEVIVTIMLNYIAVKISDDFLYTVLDTSRLVAPDQASLKAEWLKNLTNGSQIHTGIFYAIVAVIIIHLLMTRTTIGFELKSVGMNRHASQYAGMNAKRNIILAMVISGALAGLGGAMNGLGEFGYLFKMDVVAPAIGFDGMAVALLGMNHPIGILAASILFGSLKTGGNFMQLAGTPPELINIVIGLIIFFIGIKYIVTYFFDRKERKKAAMLMTKVEQLAKGGGE
ncbi:ABC transporter permease [Aerococcaceae bacterium zg-BR22]|uniref:ABC transporter permease n=1 Tax=Aerococcaceae bacterium zg-1292 TaxID=2774330 RepID=UPI004064C56E|nr:ABC transporter permease [Aerococcaceae bacterium zg-BR22]